MPNDISKMIGQYKENLEKEIDEQKEETDKRFLIYYKWRIIGPFTEEQISKFDMDKIKKFIETIMHITPEQKNIFEIKEDEPPFDENDVYILVKT